MLQRRSQKPKQRSIGYIVGERFGAWSLDHPWVKEGLFYVGLLLIGFGIGSWLGHVV